MKLFYREKGHPTLPPLILLHGLWGASDNWLLMAGLLSESFHVILPDFRNHGCSPHDPDMDYKVLSEDIHTFIQDLDLRVKPFLAGHSMGGKTLMLLLLQHPDIATKAAIIDIAPRCYPSLSSSMHVRLLDYIQATPLRKFISRQEIHQNIRIHFSAEEEVQILLKNLTKNNQGYTWKVNAAALRNHLTDLMDWPGLACTSVYPADILFIKAACSDYLAEEISPEIKHYFPTARQITVPEASHRIHTDQPNRLAHILSDFFHCSGPL